MSQNNRRPVLPIRPSLHECSIWPKQLNGIQPSLLLLFTTLLFLLIHVKISSYEKVQLLSNCFSWFEKSLTNQSDLTTQIHKLIHLMILFLAFRLHLIVTEKNTKVTCWHRTQMWLYEMYLNHVFALWSCFVKCYTNQSHSYWHLNISLFGSWCLTVEMWCYSICDRRERKEKSRRGSLQGRILSGKWG